MKGLKEYIRKNGKHITEKLLRTINGKWSVKDIEKSAQKEVYYNVTDASKADLAYHVNRIHKDTGWSKRKCLIKSLDIIGNYKVGRNLALRDFIQREKDFDFTPYI